MHTMRQSTRTGYTQEAIINQEFALSYKLVHIQCKMNEIPNYIILSTHFYHTIPSLWDQSVVSYLISLIQSNYKC